MQSIPLAERMRPKTLDEYIGQQHLVGKDAILRKTIESGRVPSMIFWGPPGVGKTTLALIIAQGLQRPFFSLSAIESGVKDVRAVIEKAQQAKDAGENAILFIDEIHRFNKAQQDSLLGAVERGIITLIGATTENPSFEVIAPLLSRCQVYILKNLEKADLTNLIQQAIQKDVSLAQKKIVVKEDEALLRLSGGDARKLLNLLDLVADSTDARPLLISNELVMQVAQQKLALYDKGGEQHYDIISVFIKSIRGSDPNAAVYWMARMIAGGEDPKFIARRMLILASEDIGNANPTAVVIANACFQAVENIGYPECRIILSQCAIYLATSPKSNASYLAIDEALEAVRKKGDLSVPLHLRNAPTKLMKELGYGLKYDYSHNNPNHFAPQEYLPDELAGTRFYDPANNPRENENRSFLKQRWQDKYGY